jgi:lipopolysaccharide biosynthesis glycosyltransferase
VPKKGHGDLRFADLNGGMFIFQPNQKLWKRMMNFINTCDHLGDFKFPDQDFLAEFFEDKWLSVPWRFNAIKTHRHWHHNIRRDNAVICLHYIVGKPWAARIAEDGTAGYKQKDGETHKR